MQHSMYSMCMRDVLCTWLHVTAGRQLENQSLTPCLAPLTGRECTARTAVFLPSSCLSCLLASLRIVCCCLLNCVMHVCVADAYAGT